MYTDGVNGLKCWDNEDLSHYLMKFALFSENNGLRYKVAQDLKQLATLIKEYSKPNTTHIWYNLDSIKRFIDSIYFNEIKCNDKRTKLVKKYGCWIKALCVMESNIDDLNNDHRGFYAILYHQSFNYTESESIKMRLKSFCCNYNAKYDEPWNVNLDNTMINVNEQNAIKKTASTTYNPLISS